MSSALPMMWNCVLSMVWIREWLKKDIKKMSGMFFVVAMTEKTSYRGRIPVFVYFSGCVLPGQNFST
jgi:hypothetical protein